MGYEDKPEVIGTSKDEDENEDEVGEDPKLGCFRRSFVLTTSI